MHRSRPTFLHRAAFATALLGSCSTFANENWITVDDDTIAGNSAAAAGVAVDGSGYVYAVGWAGSPLVGSLWMVKRSTDGGATFSFNSSYNLPGGGASGATAIAVDSANRIFVVGSSNDAANNNGMNHWIVRESTNQGMSWATVHDFVPFGNDAFANSIVIDPSDNIYVTGQVFDANNPPVGAWMTMVSTDHGVTWTRSDYYHFVAGQDSMAQGLCNIGANIFAVGFGNDANLNLHWVTRRRLPTSGWATVDTYSVLNASSAAFSCTGLVAQNTAFTSGGYYSGVSNDWLVRVGINGGTNWSNNELLVQPAPTNATFIRADASGLIYVGGTYNANRWYVQKSTNQGGAWTVSDVFSPAGASEANPVGFTYSPTTGKRFVVGGYLDANSINHWIVRRL